MTESSADDGPFSLGRVPFPRCLFLNDLPSDRLGLVKWLEASF